MYQEVIDICRSAAKINQTDPLRKGNIVRLGTEGIVIVAGDIHGHRRNFERIITKANLQDNPNTHIVIQEILHGGMEDEFQGCMSFHLFYDVIRYQMQFPGQVHLIMGNHDTAIINDASVLKAGREMNLALKSAMQRCFNQQFNFVYQAMKEYLISQPLAVKCSNGIWISHSLPADKYAADFDTTVFDKELVPADLFRLKPAYLLTWGRHQSQQTLDMLVKKLDAKIFILGHQAQETGWTRAADNLLIIASDHNHGCILAFDLSQSYTTDELAELIVPLASIA
jgi:predicted phosphodiesterase